MLLAGAHLWTAQVRSTWQGRVDAHYPLRLWHSPSGTWLWRNVRPACWDARHCMRQTPRGQRGPRLSSSSGGFMPLAWRATASLWALSSRTHRSSRGRALGRRPWAAWSGQELAAAPGAFRSTVHLCGSPLPWPGGPQWPTCRTSQRPAQPRASLRVWAGAAARTLRTCRGLGPRLRYTVLLPLAPSSILPHGDNSGSTRRSPREGHGGIGGPCSSAVLEALWAARCHHWCAKGGRHNMLLTLYSQCQWRSTRDNGGPLLPGRPHRACS